nr:hypothetical protein [Solanum aethiopicum]
MGYFLKDCPIGKWNMRDTKSQIVSPTPKGKPPHRGTTAGTSGGTNRLYAMRTRHIALPPGSRLPLRPKTDQRRVGNPSQVFGIRHQEVFSHHRPTSTHPNL